MEQHNKFLQKSNLELKSLIYVETKLNDDEPSHNYIIQLSKNYVYLPFFSFVFNSNVKETRKTRLIFFFEKLTRWKTTLFGAAIMLLLFRGWAVGEFRFI